MPRGLRRLLLGVGVLVLAAALAVVVAVYLLLRPDRFTVMLQEQAQQAGLLLNLGSPASPALFPRPALDLNGITLSAKGADSPILLATHGRLVLPWRTLFGAPTAISRMEVDAPRVDLDALQAWLAALPPQAEGSVPAIPRIDAGIHIEHGSVVRGNQLLLGNVTLSAGTLAPGLPFPLKLSASTADGVPLQLRLTAIPRMQGAAVRLDDVQLHLSQAGNGVLTLAGHARWHGAADATARLAGKLDRAGAGSDDVALALTPANQTHPLLLHLQLDGTGKHIDLQLPPLALAHWWDALRGAADQPSEPTEAVQPGVPPGSGSVQMAKLQIGSLRIDGLSIQAGDDAPAPAASAARP